MTPALAFAASYVGSLLGLMCAARGRLLDGWARRGWLAIAAVSLGGTGIWVMHFIAMTGFSVTGTPIRYRVPLTVAAAVLAIAAVGAGLAMAGNDSRKLHRVAAGGLLTGLGVAGMHYLGMAAIVLKAHVGYDPVLVALSVLVAVVAAVVALWFTLVIRRRAATMSAAALMAAAICGMHYTGMAALRLTPDSGAGTAGGTSLDRLLLPVLLVVGIVTVVLLIFVAFSASPTELAEDARFTARLERSIAERQAWPTIPPGVLGTPAGQPAPGRPGAATAERRPSPTPTGARSSASRLVRPGAGDRRR